MIHQKILLFIACLLAFKCTQGTMFSQGVNHWEMVVTANDDWNYSTGEAEPDFEWTDLTFDDSNWSIGKGGIGYADNDDGTEISPTTSVFLRHEFTLSDTSVIYSALLDIDYDDAFVAYINGVEIARANIGFIGVRPSFDEFASSEHEAQMYSGGLPERYKITKEKLKEVLIEGVNVLSVQVHNVSENSSDLSSNCYFFVGIDNENTYYRALPEWFVEPVGTTSHLPIIVIETEGKYIDDDVKITAKMKVVNHKDGCKNSFFDAGTDYDGLIGIETRGQSSQMHPKKSYSIEIRNELGEGIDTTLLGLPSEEDWVLNANYMDKTLLRNAFCYHLGGLMFNEWQPRYKFCEVYLNQDYIGVYMLMEKIKRDKNRVNISTLKPDEISGDDLTGGYIIKADKTGDLDINDYFTSRPNVSYLTARDIDFTYVYPKAEKIVYEQKKYIQDFLVSFQDALNGSDFKDSEKGFKKFIDMPSFIDFEIINELGNNVDGYRYSTYFYKKKDSKGGKFFAGPLWDFDLCFGNQQFDPFTQRTDVWLYSNWGDSEGYPMHWWARMMQDDDYRNQFSSRWHSLREDILKTENLLSYIDDTIAYLGEAIDRNFQRWPILGEAVWPVYNPWGQTYEEEVQYFKDWLNFRLQWMDATIEQPTAIENINDLNVECSIYPNPVSSYFNFKFQSYDIEQVEVILTNLEGKEVLQKLYYPTKIGEQDLHVDLPPLKPSFYLLKVKQGNRFIDAFKIVVK